MSSKICVKYIGQVAHYNSVYLDFVIIYPTLSKENNSKTKTF